MEIIGKSGLDELATVYLAVTQKGRYLEFVESLQPPHPIEDKWVLIISVLYGCPVSCLMCDAGIDYSAKVSKEEMFAQIDHLFTEKMRGNISGVKKLKIQFARMGDPAFNTDVLDVINEFDSRYEAPGFYPSISTIGPARRESFFERLSTIKKEKFYGVRMQFQFSVHTTNSSSRDKLIPVRKMSFKDMSDFGESFFEEGDKKISLNFAASNEYEINPLIISDFFDPSRFIIKLTPLNPTYNSRQNSLTSMFTCSEDLSCLALTEEFQRCGFDVIVSIGENKENNIGSNCGQFVKTYLNNAFDLKDAYAQVNKSICQTTESTETDQ